MLFGSNVLELAIGVSFIYLMLSLICSAVNEVLAANTKRRAWMLEEGVRNLLLDEALNKSLTPEAISLKRVALREAAPGEVDAARGGNAAQEAVESGATLSAIFYEHPLIKALYQPSWRGREYKKPAYIPARTFALALLDIITPEKKGEPRTIEDVRAAVERLPAESTIRRSLLMLIEEAEGDMEKLRVNVEDWFNVAMDRVSDWYKRRTHRIILAVGLGLAAMLNADSIMIYRVLYSEPPVRAAVLTQAESFAQSGAALDSGAKLDDRIKEYRQLENLGMPIGWSNKGAQVLRRPTTDFRRQTARSLWEWFLKIVGLLITAVALSLGAPFWFDLLNRFISFRAALKPPEATPEKRERSMSLTTPPRPPNEPGSSAMPLAGASGEKPDDNQNTKQG